jgi:beta-galactosidase
VDGPGEIAGVDNGDPTNLEAFKSDTHPAFNGLWLVVVQAKAGQPGPIILRAESGGLVATSVTVLAK